MQMSKTGVHRTYSLALVLLVAAGAIFALAGCGGDDDSGSAADGGVASNEAGQEGSGNGSAGEGEAGDGGADGGSLPGAGGEEGGGGAAPGADGFGSGGGEGNGSGQGGSSQGRGALGGGSAKGGKRGSSGSTQGGSTGEESGGSDAKASFVKEADEICLKWGKQIQVDAQKGYSGDLNGTNKQVQEGIDSLVQGIEKYVVDDLEAELRDVSALAAPAEAQEAQAAALGAIQVLIDGAKSDPKGLLVGSSDTSEKAEGMTKPHGFTACGGLVGEVS